MKEATENILIAAIKADCSITEKQLQEVLTILKFGRIESENQAEKRDKILSRQEVSVLIGKSPAMVDYYTRVGVFRRIYLIGKREFTMRGTKRIRNQAQGISQNSVIEALKNELIKSPV